jgi:hypothetical protein
MRTVHRCAVASASAHPADHVAVQATPKVPRLQAFGKLACGLTADR